MTFDTGSAQAATNERWSELFWMVAFLLTLTSRHSNAEMSISSRGGMVVFVYSPAP
jgi:hypothetical protein